MHDRLFDPLIFAGYARLVTASPVSLYMSHDRALQYYSKARYVVLLVIVLDDVNLEEYSMGEISACAALTASFRAEAIQMNQSMSDQAISLGLDTI